jgi:predicted transposase YbfD/YdcC
MQTETSILKHLARVRDPRNVFYITHPLINILSIALVAVICVADDWSEVVEFGDANEDWFGTWLDMRHGVPSQDTFERVFARINPDVFAASVLGWIQSAVQLTAGEVVAVDGKKLRGSADRYLGAEAITLVNAWAVQTGVMLGQLKVGTHSNEIPSLKALLKLLTLKGCIVTVDAMHCQTDNAREITSQGGDYVFPAKTNQAGLCERVAQAFEYAEHSQPAGQVALSIHVTEAKAHGRIEHRRCGVITDEGILEFVDPDQRWFGLKSIARIERTRTDVLSGQVERNTVYYISSLNVSAACLGSIVRSHWTVENSLHWVMDVAFNEDRSRTRKGHAAENFAQLRRLALSLINQTPIPNRTKQPSIKVRRKRAFWDVSYLWRVLGVVT